MLVTRGFLITVGNMIDKPPLFHAGVHCGTDLDGKISAVIFVHEIAKGNIHPAGQFLALKTDGRWVDEMVLKAPAAMKFALGENPKSVYNDRKETPVTRMATAALIREHLAKAQEYQDKQAKADGDPDQDMPDYDAKLEALVPAGLQHLQGGEKPQLPPVLQLQPFPSLQHITPPFQSAWPLRW